MKTVLSLTTVILFSLTLFSQSDPSLVQYPVSDYNFGVIAEEGGSVSYSFEVTNGGTSPLIISRVATSCGCTTPEWTKEPIAPMSKGIIKAIYDPKGRPGPFNKTITVYTNVNPAGTVLTIRGKVTPRKLTVEDIYRRRLNDLGLSSTHLNVNRVFANQVITDTIGIFNFGTNPINVTLKGVPNHLTVKVEPETLKPQQQGKITITFDSNKRNEWGFVVDRFSVLVNNETPQNNLISISANIEEDFSKFTEEQLENSPRISFVEMNKDFGNVKEGESINHEFVFSNTGKSDLIIRKIKASCGCTTVNPKVTVIKPGESSSLSATFRTSGFTGRQSKSITVITNDPKSSTQTLRLSGTVTKEE